MAIASTETEKMAIEAVLERYVESVEKADLALYAQVMAHDAGMVNYGTSADPIVGWDELEEAIRQQNAALSGTRIAQSDVQVTLSPDGRFAWATSLWDFRAMVGEQPLALPVRCTWVLEHRETGWVIVHFHKSVAAPE